MKIKNRLKKFASKVLSSKHQKSKSLDAERYLDAERLITENLNLNLDQRTIGIFGGLVEKNSRKQSYEQITIKDLMEENLDDLLPKIIKSDPSIDQAVDFFTTLTTQNGRVTAETDNAERAIKEINEMLEERNNPLELCIAHCASSLIMRGDICAETEFNNRAEPLNFWINDPSWVEWRLVVDEENNTTKWGMGTYQKGMWEEVISPNVFYLSGNPLIGERSSRSPIQTALFPAISQTSMIKSLQSIIDVHAWAQTLFSVKKLEMLRLEAEDADIGDVNENIITAMKLISEKLSKKRPDQIMGVTDDIEPVKLPGSGESYAFTKEIGDLYDKRVSTGAKTPSTVGGQQQRADYSTRQQNLFYSVYLQSGQERVRKTIEWGYRRFLRSRGITDDPIYESKSVNVEARMIEAQAFQEIMEGINLAVQAGMPLPVAIEFFEEESGQTFSATLKNRIEQEYVPPQQTTQTNTPAQNQESQEARRKRSDRRRGIGININNSNNSGDNEDDEMGEGETYQDNQFVISAGATYLKKKILNQAKKDLDNATR